jgi:glucosamine 6-phosphate synthetase-like amidotransferase/phosphosugar isomerase protein
MQSFIDSNKKSFSITNDNVDMTNRIANRGKKDKLKVQEERLESKDKKSSRFEKFTNKVLKEQPTLNQYLKQKREKRKKLNMKKYTKIQIKRAK